MIPGRAPAGLYSDEAFRAGVARLGERGLTYDTWHYHYQNRDFLEFARAVPGTTMVLDHFGTPLGVGPYETQREQIFERPVPEDQVLDLLGEMPPGEVPLEVGMHLRLHLPPGGQAVPLDDLELPADIVAKTAEKYREALIRLTAPNTTAT
jgi:hypothetical protein